MTWTVTFVDGHSETGIDAVNPRIAVAKAQQQYKKIKVSNVQWTGPRSSGKSKRR